jgi:hypothetical protein
MKELMDKVLELDRFIPKALDCYTAIAAKTDSGYLVKLEDVLKLLEEEENAP